MKSIVSPLISHKNKAKVVRRVYSRRLQRYKKQNASFHQHLSRNGQSRPFIDLKKSHLSTSHTEKRFSYIKRWESSLSHPLCSPLFPYSPINSLETAFTNHLHLNTVLHSSQSRLKQSLGNKEEEINAQLTLSYGQNSQNGEIPTRLVKGNLCLSHHLVFLDGAHLVENLKQKINFSREIFTHGSSI